MRGPVTTPIDIIKRWTAFSEMITLFLASDACSLR